MDNRSLVGYNDSPSNNVAGLVTARSEGVMWMDQGDWVGKCWDLQPENARSGQ